MNQAELRQLAEQRLLDAQALIGGSRWEFAYYTAGYSIECALKSCILSRMIHTGWVFDDEVKRIDDCRTHDFMKLVAIAGLMDELNAKLKASAQAGDDFVTNWDVVKQWKVTSRYEAKLEADAKNLFAAISDEPHGVLPWIRTHW